MTASRAARGGFLFGFWAFSGWSAGCYFGGLVVSSCRPGRFSRLCVGNLIKTPLPQNPKILGFVW